MVRDILVISSHDRPLVTYILLVLAAMFSGRIRNHIYHTKLSHVKTIPPHLWLARGQNEVFNLQKFQSSGNRNHNKGMTQ